MRNPAFTGFLGTRQYAVTQAQRAFAPAFNHAQFGDGNAFRLPPFGNGDNLTGVDFDNFKYGHTRHTAHFVKGGLAAVD